MLWPKRENSFEIEQKEKKNIKKKIISMTRERIRAGNLAEFRDVERVYRCIDRYITFGV